MTDRKSAPGVATLLHSGMYQAKSALELLQSLTDDQLSLLHSEVREELDRRTATEIVEYIVSCDTCGCCLTLATAREKMWGKLKGKPQCSRECAEVLYTKEYVAANWQPAT